MLRVEDLSIRYGKIQVVHKVSFKVRPREIVALIGANGAGKTSLLNAIIGIKKVEQGEIHFKGKNITSLPAWTRVSLGIGIVPEGGRIFPELSVKKNLQLGAYPRKSKDEIRETLDEVYALFPVLREREKQPAGTLSGGERQMLAIGRALMGEPSLLLVDEISMGLMPKLVPQVFQTILRLREEKGIGVLLAEQNARESLTVADRVLVMENGHIVLEGSPQELLQDDRIKAAYLGL